jgi:hypothetical protein
MTWTGSGRKTAALCAAVVFLGALAQPAHADPLPTVFQVPASPEIPSPDDIAAAKTSEGATAEQVSAIDRLLADASTAQEASLAASLQANNSYAEALAAATAAVSRRVWSSTRASP